MRALLTAAALWLIAVPAIAQADEVPLNPQEYSLLIGSWVGVVEARNTSGETVSKYDVKLTVNDDGTGTFWISEPEHEWATAVKIKGGKVELYFGYVDRLFAYGQTGEASLLAIKYDGEVNGQPTKNSLTLIKRAD
jgi:hypothetical protein